MVFPRSGNPSNSDVFDYWWLLFLRPGFSETPDYLSLSLLPVAEYLSVPAWASFLLHLKNCVNLQLVDTLYCHTDAHPQEIPIYFNLQDPVTLINRPTWQQATPSLFLGNR